MEMRPLATVAQAPNGATKGKQTRVKLGRKQARRPRSAVTSGRRQFINGSPNSAWARRYYDCVFGLVSDAGGRDQLSAAQFALCQRAAALQCECERMDARLSQGQEINLDTYGRAASHLRRILEALGLERRAKDISGQLDNGEVARLLSYFEPQPGDSEADEASP